jgi:mRNA interferase MazF
MNKVSPKQFEIWITSLDPAIGSEPGKTSPVVIVQSDVLNNEGHASTVICAITSQPRKGGSILRLPVTPSPQNGLQKPSHILCDHMRAVDLSRFDKRVGILDGEMIVKLKQSLTFILGLQ